MLDYCLTTVWPHKTNHLLCKTIYLIELNYIQFNSKCKIVSRSSYSSTRYWNTNDLVKMSSRYFTLYNLVEMVTRYLQHKHEVNRPFTENVIDYVMNKHCKTLLSCCLTSQTPQNSAWISILIYVAEKYIIPAMVKQCFNLLELHKKYIIPAMVKQCFNLLELHREVYHSCNEHTTSCDWWTY